VWTETLSYLRLIRESGRFDPAGYRRRYGGTSFLARCLPALHYVLEGEGLGYRPFGSFAPYQYLSANGDVADHGIAPLRHYLEYGIAEGRLLRPVPEAYKALQSSGLLNPCPATPFDSPARIAAVVHVFHGELWPELAERLRTIPEPFDLFCTVTDRAVNEGVAEAIGRDFERSQVLVIPNHGRDLFPFVWIYHSGVLDSYAALCKIHTKKSRHLKEGGDWRQFLAGELLPSEKETGDLIERFLLEEKAGMVTAPGQIIEGIKWWDINRYRLEELLRPLALDFEPESVRFAAGSMYWVKPTALRQLKSLDLTACDFELEDGQNDGTTAHLMERAVGFLTEAEGFQLTDIAQFMGGSEPLEKHLFFQPSDEREMAEASLPSRQVDSLEPHDGMKFQLNLDECSVRGVIGWVVNHEEPDRRVTVELIIDQELIGRRLADDFREDLSEARIGNGRFGFVFPVPESIFDGESHGVQITTSAGDIGATSFGFSHSFPATEALGEVWRSGETAKGWCCNPTHPENPPTLELIVDGYTIGVTAPKPEEGKTGEDEGQPSIRYPFAFKLKQTFSEDSWKNAIVRIHGSRLVLPWKNA